MKYKIDKNVPLPVSKYGNNYGRWLPLVNGMESGDSVLLKNKKEAMGLRLSLLRNGFVRVAFRRDGTGVRVWGFKTLKHYKETMGK